MPDPAPNGLRWQAVSAIDHPADHGLHLWRIDLCQGDAATDAQALAWLSVRQQARHARLRIPIHRRRYLRAQAGYRALLTPD